jgi:prevent-host-death family protein
LKHGKRLYQKASEAKRAGFRPEPDGILATYKLKRCHDFNMAMLDITKEIQSLTTFRRRSGDFIKQLKKSKRPVVLTVKGRAAAVVQDAKGYQRLLDLAARAEAEEGIRQGLEDARKGRTRPAEEFFAEFEARHGLSR